MKFQYDKKVDALAIHFNDKPYVESDEIQPNVIFDYDRFGKVIGIEILQASKMLAKDFIPQFSKKISLVVS